MERRLGNFEHAWVLSSRFAPLAVVGVLRLNRAPSAEALRAALEAAGRRHPLLRCRIEKRGRQFWFTDRNPTGIRVKVVPRRGEAQWREQVEILLNTGLDSLAEAMAACTLLRPDDRGEPGEILLALNHAVVDGDSGMALLNELVAGINAAAAGRRTGEPAGSRLPPPVEARFPPAFRGLRGIRRRAAFIWRQLGDELHWQWRTRGRRKAPVHPAASCRVVLRQLSKGATARLVRAGRRHRVTLNSAVSTAMLMAASRHLYGPGGRLLRHITFSGLRPWLKPVPAGDSLGCCIGMVRITQQVSADRPLWQLARRVNAKIHQAASRGDKFVSALMAKPMMKAAFALKNTRMATTAMSYMGVVEPAGDGPIKVRALHSFVSNFTVGPEFVGMARIMSGRLALDLLYLDSDMTAARADAIADDVVALLSDRNGQVQMS